MGSCSDPTVMQLVLPRKDAETDVSPTPYSDLLYERDPTPVGRDWPYLIETDVRQLCSRFNFVSAGMIRGNTHRWPAHRREAMSRREVIFGVAAHRGVA
jgi:hypothetical protein